ncbi:MAG: glutamate synthase subunit beta [Coriobacteriales bacterium]|jgi:glutamate synthase (NADPH/NADH) small chain|nr:glutamate synthase subunit beta [Coriobacteriales bacterium]
MDRQTAFLEFERAEATNRPVRERIRDFGEFHELQPVEVLREQAARCMDCGVSFCHAGMSVDGLSIGCPLSNLIPEMNDLIYRGLFDEAYERLRRTNPFPEFTGRVCPALCEGSCTLGEHEPPVTIKDLEHFLDRHAQATGLVRPCVPLTRTGHRVAVIGSGPAGLACAYHLNQLGEGVTVFERADRPGGLLMYGVPTMKLDKGVIERRVEVMKEEGIRFELNAEVGGNIPLQRLLDEFDALVLCGGAGVARPLDVPGGSLGGVVYAIDYLTNATRVLIDKGHKGDEVLDAKGKDVVIVGGGDTGTDCLATAIRQRARSVVQFQHNARPPEARTPSNPWPLWPRVLRTDYGQLEAIEVFGRDPRVFGTSVKEVVGDADGRVVAARTARYTMAYEGARRIRTEVEGSEKLIPADLVLIAMGFSGPERTLVDALGLKTDARGAIATGEGSYHSSLNSVFAAGDAHRGQSLVVWALVEGCQAAKECHAFLNR